MRVCQLSINNGAPTPKHCVAAATVPPLRPLQEALKDAEGALKERSALVARVKQLQQRLEEEQASRGQLKERVQRKLAEAEQEVGGVRVGGGCGYVLAGCGFWWTWCAKQGSMQ